MEDKIELTKCDKCGQVSTEPQPLIVCKHTHGKDKDFRFCGQECHDQYYMAQLRQKGL